MTVGELEEIVFEALAAYRDNLDLDQRTALGGFFVGRTANGIAVYGGILEPLYLVSIRTVSS